MLIIEKNKKEKNLMKINIGIGVLYRCLCFNCFLLESWIIVFYIGKIFKILIFYKKVLKFNIKIKMVCIFRIFIYKIVNEFFMCFFCR